MNVRRLASIGAIGLGSYVAACSLGTTWGSTREERRRYLPSDDVIPHPMIVTDHAITIRGGREDVWPWLTQMGWHRAGWYTYRWVDRLLFPANAPAATTILPGLQGLAVGDRIPDGPPESGCHFVVELLEPTKLLVLRSHSHLPPWPRDAWLDWVWTYALDDVDGDHVRLHLRTRARLGPAPVAWAYRAALWTDLVMARSHLRGIRARVEGTLAS